MEANSVDEVQVIPDDKPGEEKKCNPACDENDEKNQDEEVKNPDQNSEINKEDAEHEISIIQNDQDDDGKEETQKNEKPDQKSDELPEEEQINQLFENSKVKLSDGTEAPMYSRGPRYSTRFWLFNCHLCSLGGFPTLPQLKRHINNRKHITFLERMPIDAAKYKEGLNQIATKRFNNPIKIYPGEIITEITRELQDRVLPVEEEVFEPRPPEFIYKKLINSEPLHIYNKIAPVIGLCYCFKMNNGDTIDYYCALCDVQFINSCYKHLIGNEHRAKYGDKHFPRLLAKISSYLSDVIVFKKQKQKAKFDIFRKVYRSIELKKGLRQVHIVQTSVDHSLCMKHCSKILHYGDNHVLTTDEELKEMIKKCANGNKILEPDPSQIAGESARSKALFRGGIDASKHTPTKKQELPKEEKMLHIGKDQKMAGSAVDVIDRKPANNEKMPEKHLECENEQKKFCNRNRHVEEAVKNGLNPDDRCKPSLIKKEQSLRRKRSPSPEIPVRRRRTRSPSLPNCARQDKEPPSVISVLRLLTALEDNLGSLGPKAVEYLSKSLLYEKRTGRNANQLLQNQELYVFFVTSKEKLKGQLITKLVKGQKKTAATRAIKEIETIMELFNTFCERTGKTVTAQGQNERPQIPKQQESCFNNAAQFESSLLPSYNRNIQQDFERNHDHVNQFYQYQQRGGGMDQYRSSQDYNNQSGGSQNKYDNANPNQYNNVALNSNLYEQNRSMSSHFNQGSSSSQYSQGNQGEVWNGQPNMGFRNNANNPQVSGLNFYGGSYGNNGNQRNQGYQNFRSDREGNLSTSYDDRRPNYNSNLGSLDGGNYAGNCGGNSSSLGRSGNFNAF